MSYQVSIEPTGDIIEVEEGQTILMPLFARVSGFLSPADMAPAPPASASLLRAKRTKVRHHLLHF